MKQCATLLIANLALLVINSPAASGATLQQADVETAEEDTVPSDSRVRRAQPRRLVAPLAFDDFSRPAAGTAYVIRPGWTIIPDFKVGEIYTDNIGLTASETQDDFVTELKPGIQVLGNAQRIAFETNYNLQHLVHVNRPDLDDTFHTLFASLNAELFEQLVFLDADTTLTQQNVVTTGRGAFSNFGVAATGFDIDDNINDIGERQDVLTYRASPYLRQRFGTLADVELRFTYDEVSASDIDADTEDIASGLGSGSRALRYLGDIRSGSRYLRFPWRLTYDNEQIDFDSGETTEFEQIVGRLEYVYSPSIHVLGDLGYERNSFASSEPIDDSIIWNVGGRWTPSARTMLGATYGKRFFGNQYRVNLRHQTRRTTWLLSYSEEQETVRDRQIERAVRSRGIAVGPLDPVTGDPILPDAGIPTQTNEVFVTKLFSSSAIFETERNRVTLSVFDETRDFQLSGGEESLFGVTALWQRRMSPVTNLDVSLGWTTVDGAQGVATSTGSDDFINLRVQLQHWLARSLLATVGFRRVELTSDDPESEFTENRIFGNIRMTF